MGTKGSKPAQSNGDNNGFLFVEEIREPEILFDPRKSQAVCAGVGQYLNVRQPLSATPVWDNDTRLMEKALTSSLHFPAANVTVLNSLPTSRPATVCNIEDSLKSAAANIGPEGILLFSFSGHMNLAKGALLPADHIEGDANLITVDRIVNALDSLKKTGKQIVFVLDCSFAANMARELKTDMEKEGFKACTLAACSVVERAYSFTSLGGSLFTFFLHTALSRSSHRHGCLPVGDVFKFCRSVCSALASLMLKCTEGCKVNLVDASMIPVVVAVNHYQVSDIDSTDYPDGGCWIRDLMNWLETKVEQRKVLKDHAVLSIKEVAETACCLIVHSIALKTVTQHNELALKPKTTLVSYYLTAQFLELREDVGKYLIPAVQEYIKALRAFGKSDAEMEPLDGLCRILSAAD
jgi:hypothetical protein